MKCEVCGRQCEAVAFENDQVRDKRMKRRYYYNVVHVCENCYREWQKKMNVRWDTLGGVAREAIVP